MNAAACLQVICFNGFSALGNPSRDAHSIQIRPGGGGGPSTETGRGEALPEQGRGDWVLVREKGKICPVVSANE